MTHRMLINRTHAAPSATVNRLAETSRPCRDRLIQSIDLQSRSLLQFDETPALAAARSGPPTESGADCVSRAAGGRGVRLAGRARTRDMAPSR
jgi:hypothetical protein